MATLSFHPSHVAHQGTAHPTIMSRVAGLGRAIADEWRARRAATRVESLSDEILHDIGISRGEIDAAVRYGRSIWR